MSGQGDGPLPEPPAQRHNLAATRSAAISAPTHAPEDEVSSSFTEPLLATPKTDPDSEEGCQSRWPSYIPRSSESSKFFDDGVATGRSFRFGNRAFVMGGDFPGLTHPRSRIANQRLLTDEIRKNRNQRLRLTRVHHFRQLLYRDLFHTVADLDFRFLLLIFFCVYMLAFSILAYSFWSVREECELGIDSPMEAFALSAETWFTIGYGVPDPYFKTCTSAVVIITVQGLAGLVMNGLLIGIIYTHVSSGRHRGDSIMFSRRACIRQVSGRLYLIIQLCELRRAQLLEVHARLHVVRRPLSSIESPVDGPQAFELRLSRPNDELGAMLWPVLPCVLIHEIDRSSALCPSTAECRESGHEGPSSQGSLDVTGRCWTDPVLRGVDARGGGRDTCWCKTCGESFETQQMLSAHIRYNAEQDALNGAKHGHKLEDAEASAVEAATAARQFRFRVEKFLEEEWFEIVCVVEGVDGTTAATVQTLKSYTAEEIVWDKTFLPFLDLDPINGAELDFTKMHDLVDAPPD